MKASKIVILIGFLFISGPIWFYLMYKTLVAIHASELMFFLYWIYVPVTIIIGIISKVTEND